jgi:L-alanine-DL-glutamate epimerase-like enolase superfamily enzyme
MNRIKHIRFYEVVKPLRTTFSTSLGRKDVIKSILIRVTLKDGTCGIGECPTSFTLKDETISAIKRILEKVSPVFFDMPVDSCDDKIEQFRRKYPANPMTISGLETALLRASLRNRHISEHDYWGGKTTRIETDITIPFSADHTALAKWLKYTLEKNFTAFKLKVSGNVEEDIKLISFVHLTIKNSRDDFVLRLDCNQGYNVKTFLKMVHIVEQNACNIQFFEQPLPKSDYRGLKEIKKYSPVPIILDETIVTGSDMDMAVAENLCDGVNIKIAKSGIVESRKIYDIAKKHGIKLMIGCMTETMAGLSAGIYFASGTNGFDYIDLDSIYFLYHRKHYNGITIDGPVFIASDD